MKDPPKAINVRQFPNPAEFGKIQKKQGQNGAISQHPERVTVRKVDPCNQSPRTLDVTPPSRPHPPS